MTQHTAKRGSAVGIPRLASTAQLPLSANSPTLDTLAPGSAEAEVPEERMHYASGENSADADQTNLMLRSSDSADQEGTGQEARGDPILALSSSSSGEFLNAVDENSQLSQDLPLRRRSKVSLRRSGHSSTGGGISLARAVMEKVEAARGNSFSDQSFQASNENSDAAGPPSPAFLGNALDSDLDLDYESPAELRKNHRKDIDVRAAS